MVWSVASRAARYQVMLHVDAATFRRERTHTGPATSSDGPRRSDLGGVRVSSGTSRRLICDASIMRVEVGGSPGIGSASFDTPGCQRHHRVVHEGRVQVCRDREGAVVFFTPAGRVMFDAARGGHAPGEGHDEDERPVADASPLHCQSHGVARRAGGRPRSAIHPAQVATTRKAGMKTIVIMGDADEATIQQAENCLVEAEAVLLMADNHRGYGMPVGGVAVYKDRIPPAGVGFDIGCGNKAVRTNLKLGELEDRLEPLADEIFSTLAFGVGQGNKTRVEHELFEDPVWKESAFLKRSGKLKATAQAQLGSIGAGNHYVDVFADEEDRIWVGVHFGSRHLGHSIASHFMKKAGDNLNIMDETPRTLDVNSPTGRDYIACMRLAGRYAYAGRDWVCETVVDILGGEIIDEVHNHHNYAWQEEHGGQEYWVVRKGATPAFPGQRGFVGASMGDDSVILQGVDGEESRALFYSTVHGAGRVMSRTEAAGRRRKVTTQRERADGTTYDFQEWMQVGGVVDFVSVKEKLAKKGVVLRGASADEAPEVYKDLQEVLAAHEGTIEILHTLRPWIVCMAE